MRVKPNQIINSYAGKFGDNIMSANKGSSAGTIQTLHKFTKPYNPNSIDQQLIRNTFKYALNLFYNGTDKTIGGTTWDEQTFKDDTATASNARKYIGIATTGGNTGSQLLAGSFVKLKDDVDVSAIITLNLLPQDMTNEADLIQLITATQKVITNIATFNQKDRIGFVSNN
jgi:hypothetical protein